MLRNYFKIAFRNLVKNKVHSFINIAGLSAGMAVVMLIGLWIWDEISFDRYHQNHGRLAEIMAIFTYNGETSNGPWAAVPLANELRNKYPDDFKSLALTGASNPLLTAGDKKIERPGRWAEAAFPSMFTLKMIKGSRNALNDPTSMLISRSVAEALFGNSDPVNKTVRVGNKTDMKVTGVYEDLPQNTTLSDLGFLLSWNNKDNPGKDYSDDWTNHHFQLFAQISDRSDFDKISDKIKHTTWPHLKANWEEIRLHPMDRWHLYDRFENRKMTGGRLRVVWLFGIIGCFILLLACINFMNLSTARSEKRAKEVGIRKAIGSLRGQLIRQFLGESLMMAFLALVLALALAQLLLPFFNSLANKQLSLSFRHPFFWLFILAFTLFTGLISGSYPAFYLSAFRPVKVLKGDFRIGRWSSLPRRVLVVVQFTVSVALIIGTIIVFRQIQHGKDRPVGYTREGLITVNMNTPEVMEHYEAIRNDLLRTGAVASVTASSSASTNVENSMMGYDWKGRNPNSVPIIATVFVDHDFGKTLNWKIKEGRDFSKDFPTDSGAFILNEAAVKFTGLKHPVGETIRWHGQDLPIVGVVKDMVMESPYTPIDPVFFTLTNLKIHIITMRIKPTLPVREALAKIGSVFKKYNPESPFEYRFTDEAYAAKFSDEENTGNLSTFFSILAIFISCLGLFGLASFVAGQRTKEIGVRKVLGASVFNLWALLSREFLVLVMISLFVAIPIAYYFMNNWLQNYAYRTKMSWWIFAAAGFGALAITLLTVSYQSIKAALMNPVKSLRTE